MKPFIKATEIWAPARDKLQLELVSSNYGDLAGFKEISEKKRFDYDHGLPGKAWAAGHPLVLTQFENSYFERTEAAKAAGISAGIALPVFAGDCLTGVVVFLCGDDEDSAGAIELWHCDTKNS
jgi:hypothetical protein